MASGARAHARAFSLARREVAGQGTPGHELFVLPVHLSVHVLKGVDPARLLFLAAPAGLPQPSIAGGVHGVGDGRVAQRPHRPGQGAQRPPGAQTPGGGPAPLACVRAGCVRGRPGAAVCWVSLGVGGKRSMADEWDKPTGWGWAVVHRLGSPARKPGTRPHPCADVAACARLQARAARWGAPRCRRTRGCSRPTRSCRTSTSRTTGWVQGQDRAAQPAPSSCRRIGGKQRRTPDPLAHAQPPCASPSAIAHTLTLATTLLPVGPCCNVVSTSSRLN